MEEGLYADARDLGEPVADRDMMNRGTFCRDFKQDCCALGFVNLRGGAPEPSYFLNQSFWFGLIIGAIVAGVTIGPSEATALRPEPIQPIIYNTTSPTTTSPTLNPTTASPTLNPTTASPTLNPTTANPTTASPTLNPTTTSPTLNPTTANPTTASPTLKPLSLNCGTTLVGLLEDSAFSPYINYMVTCPSDCQPIRGKPICNSDTLYAKSSPICPAASAQGWSSPWYDMILTNCEYSLEGASERSMQSTHGNSRNFSTTHLRTQNQTLKINRSNENPIRTINANTVRVGGKHGEKFPCPDHYYAVQYCGSGQNLDCDGLSSWMLCEELPTSTVNSSTDWYSTTGDQQFTLDCPEGYVVTGGCFSGSAKDCEGERLKLRCTMFNSVTVYGTQNYKKGQIFECPQLQPNQAITGICNSGSNPDCLGSHAIEYFRSINTDTWAFQLFQPPTSSPTRSPT